MSRTFVTGARNGAPRGLLRSLARVLPPQLDAFVLPGMDVARARGLEIEAAGLRPVATPRHAAVLLIVDPLPDALWDAATVVYAQMARPRAIVALGTEGIGPLPGPDASAATSQEGLEAATERVRQLLRASSWSEETEPFDAPALQPKRRRKSKPKKREAAGDGSEDASSGGGDGPGGGPRPTPEDTDLAAGMPHGETQHGETQHGGAEHGSAEQPAGEQPSNDREPSPDAMPHGGMGGGSDMGFMSMVRLTQHLPKGADGLPMERVQTPFGPFFPGLPSGLALTLWLDGDTVARADIASPAGTGGSLRDLPASVGDLAERLARRHPLAPASYRRLTEAAGAAARSGGTGSALDLGHVAALELERAASHLNWLAGFGHLLGYVWLARQASAWQLRIRTCRDVERLAALAPELLNVLRRVQRTPLLARRLTGIGTLGADELDGVGGPVARASGLDRDARLDEPRYRSLAFEPVVRAEGDALARLAVRLDEIRGSVALALAAYRSHGAGGAVGATRPERGSGPEQSSESGSGSAAVADPSLRAASIETPRGVASLRLRTNDGRLVEAELETPTTAVLPLVAKMAVGLELADALVAVASLDVSPWEVAW